MFSKIFVSLLLLAGVYTYMTKSIKDDDGTNFQKLPDTFNFELNEIQKGKPNLKLLEYDLLKLYLKSLFGEAFIKAVEKHEIKREDFREILNDDLLLKLKNCESVEVQGDIFNNDILPKLDKSFGYEEKQGIKKDLDYSQEWVKKYGSLKSYIENLIGYTDKYWYREEA